MRNQGKTREQFTSELEEMRLRITELELSLKELEGEKIEFERFFNLSHDLMGAAGFDGYWKRINPAVTKTLGYADEELLARPFLDFVHPDDKAATIEA